MRKVVLSLLSIITFLCLISCGSKPAAEEPKPEAPKVEEKVEEIEEASEEIPVVKDLTDLIHQIEDARKAAVEAGAEEKAPEQLKQADDLFASLITFTLFNVALHNNNGNTCLSKKILSYLLYSINFFIIYY